MFYDSLRTVELASHEIEIRAAGYLTNTETLPFSFDIRGDALADTYDGALFAVRHGVLAKIGRPWYTFDVLKFEPFCIQALSAAPYSQGSAPPSPRRRRAPPPLLLPSMEEKALLPDLALADCVNHFINLGGSMHTLRAGSAAVLLEAAENGEADAPEGSVVDSFDLQATDAICGVSAAGLNRAQVLQRVLKELLRPRGGEGGGGGAASSAAGGAEGEAGVGAAGSGTPAASPRSDVDAVFRGTLFAPHAAMQGIDPYAADQAVDSTALSVVNARDTGFAEAFGEPRVPRFGEDSYAFGGHRESFDPALSDSGDYVLAHLFGHEDAGDAPRRVYIAFDRSVHVVIKRLLEATSAEHGHAERLPADVLKGTVVVAVPLHDLVAYPVDPKVVPYSAEACRIAYDVLSDLFTFNGVGIGGNALGGGAADEATTPSVKGEAAGAAGAGAAAPAGSDAASDDVSSTPHGKDDLVEASGYDDEEDDTGSDGEDGDGHVLRIADCGGLCEFNYKRSTFALSDHLRGVVQFSDLADPIVFIELSIVRLESGDGDSQETIVFAEPLLDVREGGEENLPISGSGSLSVDLDLSLLPLTPTYLTFPGADAEKVSVRYFVRVTVATAFAETSAGADGGDAGDDDGEGAAPAPAADGSHFWNTNEVSFVRTDFQGVVAAAREFEGGGGAVDRV